jgi:ribulose-5-phosphate 4-epimerase/fuculose-1-phosphate aldolase
MPRPSVSPQAALLFRNHLIGSMEPYRSLQDVERPCFEATCRYDWYVGYCCGRVECLLAGGRARRNGLTGPPRSTSLGKSTDLLGACALSRRMGFLAPTSRKDHVAHKLDNTPAPATLRNDRLDRDEVWQARIDLAACFRMAARLGLQEGICNHFSAVVPGSDELFLVNPYGWAFQELTASRLLICDFAGNVVAGAGEPEATAFYIHARLHMKKPRARAAFHTHMPNATALTMTEGEPLVFAGQSALKFFGRTAFDQSYNGLALDATEGDRIAGTMGDADIVFMKNHGVMVTAPTIAEAWDDLYYLERAAEVQIRAMSTGRPLSPVSADIARRTAHQMRLGDSESARLHLESIKRILLREEPDFAH